MVHIPTDIANARLISQQIAEPGFSSIKDLVGWMGAMQAQDYTMMKWAVGLRIPGLTDQNIEDAIGRGELIRMHLMRPTWHLVSSDDIYWLLELTAPQIRSAVRSRHRDLGLTDRILARSNETISAALAGGKHLTRQEILAELENAGIKTTADNRAAHLLLIAELDGIVCSGASRGGKQTYALLEERVPAGKSVDREEALAMLAKRYFTSHYPATIQDFSWWSGLPANDVKLAVEKIKSEFASESVDSKEYWVPDSAGLPCTEQDSLYLLPAYDEFLISYKDRSASLPVKTFKRAVSSNGIFRPVIVINGKVAGLWKRVLKKDRIVIETEMFSRPGKSPKTSINAAALRYGQFLDREIEIKHA